MPTTGGGTLTLSGALSGPITPGTLYSRVQERTLLSLERFAQIINYSPMLMHGVYVVQDELQPDSSCSDPVLQYTWQPRGGGRPGRAEIIQAIAQAEDSIYRALSFSAAPRWFVDDVILSGRSSRGLAVRASNFHFIEPGVETYEFIDNPDIVWTDVDGDGYAELGSVQVTVAGTTTEDEICAFYPGMGTDHAWEVRPLRVSIDRNIGMATILFFRHLCVLPELQEQLGATGVDGIPAGNFLESLNIYRRYSDASAGVLLSWPCGTGGCGVCTACTQTTTTACISAIDQRNSLLVVQPATWNVDTSVWDTNWPFWSAYPVRARLSYRAGYRDMKMSRPLSEMSHELERAVAYLALSYLDRDWLTCEQVRNLQAHWRFDLAKSESTSAQSSSFKLDNNLLRCPFGTTRAALYAWRVVQPLRVGEAVLI